MQPQPSAVRQRTDLFAGAKIAGEVLHIGKAQRLGDVAHRHVRFHQQARNLIGPHPADFCLDGGVELAPEASFQKWSVHVTQV